MLSLATFYTKRDTTSYGHAECGIDFEYIAIFLVMHIPDVVEKKPSSPKSFAIEVWPSANSEEDGLVSNRPDSPTRGSSSPRSSPAKHGNSLLASPHSPHAPHSPSHLTGSNATGGALSPSANSASRSRSYKTTAQYLHSLRQKLPFILFTLSVHSDESFAVISKQLSGSIDAFDHENDFMVPRKVIDALGLIMCGGSKSREEHVCKILFVVQYATVYISFYLLNCVSLLLLFFLGFSHFPFTSVLGSIGP
jgi:hypothetical protein